MNITLQERTEETVRIYFERARQPFIRRMLPQKAKTVEEALEDFRCTLLPDSTSYGRTIYVDGRYVGDVWIYAIDRDDMPNAMLSYCIFAPDVQGCGIASEAVRSFLEEVTIRFELKTVGAFTYAENIASVRVLEKNDFVLKETFFEDDKRSYFYQRRSS